MEIPMEKIDELRERAGIGYREAKDVLREVDGDLLEALIYIEEGRDDSRRHLPGWGREAADQLRHFAAGLHRTRLRVKVRENTLVELPASFGALGAALFPKIAALGLIGVLFSKGSIEMDGSGALQEEELGKENLDKKESPGLGLDQS